MEQVLKDFCARFPTMCITRKESLALPVFLTAMLCRAGFLFVFLWWGFWSAFTASMKPYKNILFNIEKISFLRFDQGFSNNDIFRSAR